MTYKLPNGIKPYIDMLGDNYINIDPRKLQGNNQILLDVAFTSAKQKFFQAGRGFPHLSWDNLEIRVWPSRADVAFCFGLPLVNGNVVHYVYMARIQPEDGESPEVAMRRWLQSVGAFATVH